MGYCSELLRSQPCAHIPITTPHHTHDTRHIRRTRYTTYDTWVTTYSEEKNTHTHIFHHLLFVQLCCEPSANEWQRIQSATLLLSFSSRWFDRHLSSSIIYHLSIIYHQSSIINHQSSIINHQPSTINHQPSTINHQPSTINHQPSEYVICLNM